MPYPSDSSNANLRATLINDMVPPLPSTIFLENVDAGTVHSAVYNNSSAFFEGHALVILRLMAEPNIPNLVMLMRYGVYYVTTSVTAGLAVDSLENVLRRVPYYSFFRARLNNGIMTSASEVNSEDTSLEDYYNSSFQSNTH